MSSDIYATPDLSKKVRYNRQVQEDTVESEERQVDIYENTDAIGNNDTDIQSHEGVTLEKDELQSRYDQLSNNYSQLQKQISNASVHYSQLQDEVKQLKDKIEGSGHQDYQPLTHTSTLQHAAVTKDNGQRVNYLSLRSGSVRNRFLVSLDEVNSDRRKGPVKFRLFKMSADALAAPDLSLNVRYTRDVQQNRGEGEEDQVEIIQDEEHHADLQSQKARPHTPKNPAAVKRRSFSVTAVTLAVMYLLILAGLYIRYIFVTLDKDELQSRYDQLSNNYSQLQKQIPNASVHYSQLQDEVKQLKDKIEGKRCPDGWSRFGRSCYFQSDEKKNWQQSRADCQQRGADLVIINNKEEQKFVTELNVRGESWIGLRRTWTNRRYEWEQKWVDGSPLIET
ncbi:hypothetical protein ABVT39_014235 [Epinephelus coioides]